MATFQLKSWTTGARLFSIEINEDEWKFRFKLALQEGIKAKADFTGADLSGANLTKADLSGANLTKANLTETDLFGAKITGANLTKANLTKANLTKANLTKVDFTGADLTEADFTGADLFGANLTEANFTGANLTKVDFTGADLFGANFTKANLSEADLTKARLTKVRDDLWAVLSAAPRQVAAVREAIVGGKIDGSTYEGECADLIGTIAKAAGLFYKDLLFLKPDISRPIERFFLAIKVGDTPENNQISRIVLGWLDEWLTNMRSAFGGEL